MGFLPGGSPSVGLPQIYLWCVCIRDLKISMGCLYPSLKDIYGVSVLYPSLKYIYGVSVSETQIYEWVSVSKTMMSKEIKTE